MKQAIKEHIASELGIDDDETIAMLIDNYIETLRECIEKIQQDLRNRDAAALRLDGHSIKGCSASIGAEPLRAASQKIEYAGRDGDFNAGQAAFDELNALATRFLSEP